MGNPYCPPDVFRGIAIHGKLPDIELHVLAADYNPAVPVEVRTLVARFSEGDLLRIAAFSRNLPKMHRGEVEYRAPARGTVDNMRTIIHPRQTAHERIVVRDLPG